eukprot:11225716-Alexandrium_andersonii.AAC.1
MVRLVISRPRRCSRWNGVSRMTRLSFTRSSSKTALASSGRRPWRRARSMKVSYARRRMLPAGSVLLNTVSTSRGRTPRRPK